MKNRGLIADIVAAHNIQEIVFCPLKNWDWIVIGRVLFIDPSLKDLE